MKRKVTYFDRSLRVFSELEAGFDSILFARNDDEEGHGLRNTAIAAGGLGVAGAGGLYARGRYALRDRNPSGKVPVLNPAGGAPNFNPSGDVPAMNSQGRMPSKNPVARNGVLATMRRGAMEIPNDVKSAGNSALNSMRGTRVGKFGEEALDTIGGKLSSASAAAAQRIAKLKKALGK